MGNIQTGFGDTRLAPDLDEAQLEEAQSRAQVQKLRQLMDQGGIDPNRFSYRDGVNYLEEPAVPSDVFLCSEG